MRRTTLINIVIVFICIISISIISITWVAIPSSHHLKNHNEIADTMMNNYVFNSYVNKYKDSGVKGIHPNKKDHRKPASKPQKILKKLPITQEAVTVNTTAENTEPEVSALSIICENGGIGFTDKCICSPPYTGDRCENIDQSANDPCLKKDDGAKMLIGKSGEINNTIGTCSVGLTVDCCWKKNKRASTKIFEHIEGSLSDHQFLEKMLTNYGPWNLNDKLFINYMFTQDSSKSYQFKYKKTDHDASQFTDKPSIAFYLSIHYLDIERFETLLKNIYRPKHYYIIHIDKKLENIKELLDLVQIFSKTNNIVVLDKRFDSSWGSISYIYSELAAMGAANEMVAQRVKNSPGQKNHQWSHWINLSLDDFPTKNIRDLELFLGKNLKRNFVDKLPRKDETRRSKTWIECDSRLVSMEYQDPNQCGSNGYLLDSYNNDSFVEGSQWHFITHKFANYLISSRKPLERLLSLKFTLSPDEYYLHFILSESKLDEEWDEYNYRYIPYHRKNTEVDETDLDFKFDSYFTRKVRNNDVREAIVEKHLNFRNKLK